MAINFKIRRISQGTCMLAWISILIKKNKEI